MATRNAVLSVLLKKLQSKQVVLPLGILLAYLGYKKHKNVKAINTFVQMATAQPLALASLAGSSSILWLCSVILKDVSIVDSFWSLGEAD